MNKKLLLLTLFAASAIVACEKDKEHAPEEETGYHFVVTNTDEWGNTSEISNDLFLDYVFSQKAVATSVKRNYVPTPDGRMGISTISYAANRAAYQGTANAVPYIVNIKFRPEMRAMIGSASNGLNRVARGAAKNAAYTGIAKVDQVSAKLGGAVVSYERVFPYVEEHEADAREFGLDLWYTVTFDPSVASATKVVEAYNEISEIEVVETVKHTKVIDADQKATLVTIAPNATRQSALPFDDPMLNRQWHYDRGVQNDHVADGGHISLLRAWKKTAGDKDIIVAIIDGGVDYKHEDLADAMWINTKEIPGNEIDDDNNGYIDDVYGYNFFAETGTIIPHSHGTHVAGTVGAVNNNGKGVCGVAGGTGKGDGVRLMSCQILGEGSPVNNKEVKAIKYAADNGAIIAQNSWGFTNPNETQQSIYEAIKYFIAKAGGDAFINSPMRGGIMFFATGNEGYEGARFYPAAYPEVVSVTSTNSRGDKPKYANVGEWVNIAAPGGADPNNDAGGKNVFSTLPKGYGGMSGTSMACPHVAGVAALLLSEPSNKGKLTPETLRELVLTSVKNISDTAPGFYEKMGGGGLNASKHLSLNDNQAPDKVGNLATEKEKGVRYLTWTVPTDAGGDDIVKYDIYYDSKPITPENLVNVKKFSMDTVMKQRLPYRVELNKLQGIEIESN